MQKTVVVNKVGGKIMAGIGVVVALIIFVIIAIASAEEPETEKTITDVTVTMNEEEFEGLSYQEAEQKLNDMGFTSFSREVVYTDYESLVNLVANVVIGDSSGGFTSGDIFSSDAQVKIYIYKLRCDIIMTMSEDEFEGISYKEAEQLLRVMGFSDITHKTADTDDESLKDKVCFVEIDDNIDGFGAGDVYKSDSSIIIYTWEYTAPKKDESQTASYTTNTGDDIKKGNSGLYSYRNRGIEYYIYYIIDFDEGYVYRFIDNDSYCDKLKIESGTLNDVIIVTYHDGGDVWSNGLHFKWKNQPDHLILEDNDGFEYDFFTTSLEDALRIRSTKTIVEY